LKIQKELQLIPFSLISRYLRKLFHKSKLIFRVKSSKNVVFLEHGMIFYTESVRLKLVKIVNDISDLTLQCFNKKIPKFMVRDYE
jgi:hypothetical protein